MAFSPDGKTIAIAGDHGAVVLNVATGRPVWNVFSIAAGDGSIGPVAFSPDGKTLAPVSSRAK